MKYKAIEPNFNLVPLEEDVLKNWELKNIFEKVNSKKAAKEWVYYDGPITANGLPHYGHALTWTVKDVVPRYFSMLGNYVSRNIGWDCQGILVEYEVEKNLGFTHKSQIEEMGVDKFNALCRKSVLEKREKMVEYEERLGRWLDHNDEYSTMDSSYIESMWWALKELYKKGLLYEGYKVVAYSPRTGMTLSSHEVAEGGYKEVEDFAVTIKFKLKSEPNTYLLAWTTTPWTLPGNLMLAIGAKINYVKVLYNEEYYILANSRVEEIFKGKIYKIVGGVKAMELEGLEYEPLFNYFESKKSEGCFKVVYADHVNTEDGTGIVHLAPYGEEDFNVFMSMKIKVFDYLDETCNFTKLIPDLEGVFYKKGNELIIDKLKEQGLLFNVEKYLHSMPVDYRSGTPLIYKPIKSWYLNIDKIKPLLISEAEKINFVPEEMGKSRFVPWVKNARDWSLSRLRFWGTPLPIYVNKKGEKIVVGSFKELEELSGKPLGKNFDPHKPYVDTITLNVNGSVYTRVPEVIDVWFDSGSMPFARYHYPFDNKELFNKRFPAEFISEGDDQIRLWFYTMFVINVALFEKSPFKNVIVLGMLGDEKGKKMSKSKGNYPPVAEVYTKYGSDMLRYFLLTSPVVRGDATAFSYRALEETKKEFFTTLWNSLRYYLTYASLYNFDPKTITKSNDLLDEWMLERLNLLIKNVNKYMEKYEVMFAAREFSPFVQDLSTWYIRRSREKIANGDKQALSTLYLSLNNLSKLMAPFMPLLSDKMYLLLNDNLFFESVHLEDMPKHINSKNAQSMLQKMELVRQICSLGNSIRKDKNISLRQPLSIIKIKLSESTSKLQLDEKYLSIIKDELNVKEAKIVVRNDKKPGFEEKSDKNILVSLDLTITDELKIEGELRNLVREVQSLRKESGLEINQKINISIVNNDINKKILESNEKFLLSKLGAYKISLGNSTQIVDVK